MSLNAEALRLMRAKGLSLDDVVEIADAMERRADPTAAERKRRQREREATERDMSQRDVTRDAPPPHLDKEKSPTPPKEINPPLPPDDLEADASRSSDDEPEPDVSKNGSSEALKPEHIVEAWNDLAQRIGKPSIRMLTPERRVRLRARIAGYSLDEFREVLGNVERSPFLRGDTGKTFCTFDWLTKKANFQKILEGNYNG